MTEQAEASTTGSACLICKSKTAPYFSKRYGTYPGSPFTEDFKVDYWKCQECGFVLSDTHSTMDEDLWSRLNETWHNWFEQNPAESSANQPPYAEQALALHVLQENGLVRLDDTLDYAAGYGTLSKFLSKYFSISINIFDRYVRNESGDETYVEETDLRKYKLVINSAMFEHVRDRAALDEVNDLVADDGVLMLHTVICERVPADPDWFYLEPMVHTAFHTNKSMELLMKQWGYAASIYAPQAKSWYLFKENSVQLESLGAAVERINEEIQSSFFHYKLGFVDYWKGF